MFNYVKQADGYYAGDSSVCIGDIAGKVVDDSQLITIPVSGVPPPPPKCEDYYTESGCTDAGCYWYDDACHGEPKVPPIEIPWTMIAIGGAVVVAIIVTIFIARR